MCPSAPRVCSEPGGQKPVLSLSLDLIRNSPLPVVFPALVCSGDSTYKEWDTCAEDVSTTREFKPVESCTCPENMFSTANKCVEKYSGIDLYRQVSVYALIYLCHNVWYRTDESYARELCYQWSGHGDLLSLSLFSWYVETLYDIGINFIWLKSSKKIPHATMRLEVWPHRDASDLFCGPSWLGQCTPW